MLGVRLAKGIGAAMGSWELEPSESRRGAHLSRRQFVAGGAGIAGLYLLGRSGQLDLVGAAAAQPAARRRHAQPSLEIFSLGFPRAFVYRQASTLAGLLDYPTWLGQMAQLNGIIGKVLPEEEPVAANALTYFQQFKAQLPAKAVLLHLNGWERVPQWETTNWFPGFWLHRAGTKLTKACSSTDTTLYVGATACFSLQSGTPMNRGDDICVAAMGTDGLPDFTRAEQVVLTNIDSASGTITVVRGQYGTTPLAFASGSFIAAHVTRGPFAGNGPMLWMYNFSTMAPKDPSGHTVIDAIINGMAPGEGLAAKFAPGGPLADFDGLKLDAFSWIPPLALNPDCNNDGIADNGVFNGVNTFGLGETQFVKAVRSLVGASRLIIIDVQTITRERADSALVSGIELEGFPNLTDVNANQWSEGLANLEYYTTALTQTPDLIYPNYKADDFPPFNGLYPVRLAMAASLISGTEFTFYTDPDGATPINGKLQNLTIWDEVLGGALQAANWLGQPVGPARHVALKTDELNGSGVVMNSSFISLIRGTGVKFVVANQGSPGASITLHGTVNQAILNFRLQGVPLTGSDLVLTMDVMSSPEPAYSPTLLRRLYVAAQRSGGTVTNTQSTPTGSNWFSALLYFRGLQGTGPTATLTFTIEGPQGVSLRNVRVYNAPEVAFRQFQNGAVFANPSLAAYTFPVSTLAPGAKFNRLQGSAGQDPVTNNGQPLGSTVTIPATDALIVVNA